MCILLRGGIGVPFARCETSIPLRYILVYGALPIIRDRKVAVFLLAELF